jgi:cytochrome c-type biogenesis protein CcmF
VRSGVLTSVHAFANDPRRGLMILVLLSVVIGASLTIFAVRAPASGLGGRFGMLSRETLLLSNNVLLVVAAACVLLGTLYPLAMDALGLGKISVGPPYFNSVFVPIVIPLFLLAALGPVAAWKNAQWQALARHMRVPAMLACVAAAGLPFALGHWTPGSAIGAFCATWLAASGVQQLRKRLRSGNPPASYWGMQLAHLGVAITVLGVSVVKNHETERDVRMAVGDTTQVGGYVFRFAGTHEVTGPNYRATQGEIVVEKDGHAVRTLYPQKRNYFSSTMPMTETAIDTGPFRDLYVALGEPLDGGAWAVRVYYKPFVDWIWAGALLMVLGGALTLADRRYRVLVRRSHPVLQELAA